MGSFEKSHSLLFIFGLIVLLSSGKSFANSKTGELKVFEFDDNKDSFIDNKYFYQNGELVKHLNDRNYDKVFDYNFQVSSKKTEIKLDEDGDHFFEKIKIITDEDKKSFFKIYKISAKTKDQTSTKKLVSKSSFSNIQFQDILAVDYALECSEENYFTQLRTMEKFVNNFTPVLEKIEGPLSSFSPGVNIHQSCIENFGKKKFSNIMSNALEKGLSCLSRLAKIDVKEKRKGELFNLYNLLNIQLSGQVKPTTVICHDKTSSWQGSLAQASTSKRAVSGVGTEHPFISLNPKMEKGFFGGIKNGPSQDELEGVVFHELIHNFGYRHGQDIDMSYGCESCCFGEGEGNPNSPSCRICRGNYGPGLDENYIRDIALMSKSEGSPAAESFIYKNLKEMEINQKNVDSIFISLAIRGAGVQKEFLELAEKKGLKVTMTKQTESDLKAVKKYRPINNFIDTVNKAYALALSEAFFDKKPFKALLKLTRVITAKDLREVEALGQRDAQHAGKLARGMDIMTSEMINL